MSTSILVPVYNTEKFLPRCINSLLHQRLHGMEIILVDDGSTDRSPEICEDYAANDCRVRVIHKPNGGEASARQAGLAAATGEYVMFCDSDDEYLPDTIEKLEKTIRNPGIDLAVGAYLEKSGGMTRYGTTHQQQYSGSELVNRIITDPCEYGTRYIMSTVNGKIFRTSILQDNQISFDERYRVGNDTLFVLDYLKHCNAIFDIFSAAYIYYKFSPDEHIQGMAYFYPDSFKLHTAVLEKQLEFQNINRRFALARFYDNLISLLISAVAYEDLFHDFRKDLAQLLAKPVVKSAAEAYQKIRITDREDVRMSVMNGDADTLYGWLAERAKAYIERNGKQHNARLMVNENV